MASTSPSQDKAPFIIDPVRSPADLSAARDLIKSYVSWLDIDLTFQNFEVELASLPGAYAPLNGGEILLARSNIAPKSSAESSPSEAQSGLPEGAPLGMVALRALPVLNHTQSSSSISDSRPKICEMKRLWVTEAGRGMGVGRALVWEILVVAKRLGYTKIRLDTLGGGKMMGAQKLYAEFGFEEIDKYYDNPFQETVYLGKKL